MAKKATHYSETPIEKWNAAHFQKYLQEKHVERYGIHYVNTGGVVAERNLIAKYIGTTRKSGMYSKSTIKAFIDECFMQYKPTQQYPGLSFWFMVTYMSRLLQQAELFENRKKATEQVGEEYEEVMEWL